MLRYTLIVIGIAILSIACYSQEVIATDGDFGASALGSLSWTLGEVVTETETNSTEFFTQGFQQNYEDIVGLNSLSFGSDILIYPNPFSSSISLNFGEEQANYVISIHDYQYKLVYETELSFQSGFQQMSMNLSELSDGFYFLVIKMQDTDESFVKRIVKTNTQ